MNKSIFTKDNINVSRRIVVFMWVIVYAMIFFTDMNGGLLGFDPGLSRCFDLIILLSTFLFSVLLLVKDHSNGWRVFLVFSILLSGAAIFSFL